MAPGGAAVLLDAARSRSRTGKPLTFAWQQTAGAKVTLARTDAVSTAFAAPIVYASETLAFEVTVSDGTLTAKDSVDVQVAASPLPPDLTQLPDLGALPDLAEVPDLAVAADLTAPADLSDPPDFRTAPDLQMATTEGKGCGCDVGRPRRDGAGLTLFAGLAACLWLDRRRKRAP